RRHRPGRRRGRAGAALEGGGRDRPEAGPGDVGARPGAGAVMTPAEAVERCNVLLAHLWMVRTFLKHADEIQADEELLDVPRTVYDSIRAVEPAFQRGAVAEYLRRLGGKLPKLWWAGELVEREAKAV